MPDVCNCQANEVGLDDANFRGKIQDRYAEKAEQAISVTELIGQDLRVWCVRNIKSREWILIRDEGIRGEPRCTNATKPLVELSSVQSCQATRDIQEDWLHYHENKAWEGGENVRHCRDMESTANG